MAELMTVDCPTHGKTHATFLCSHLAENPVQPWFCCYPSKDNPWPDAWCALCDAEYQKEGEWNERNTDKSKIQLACHHCYESGRGKSVQSLEGETLEAWNRFVDECSDELDAKQDQMFAEYDLENLDDWKLDLAAGQLTFLKEEKPRVLATFVVVGSLSTVSETWLWSWAHFGIADSVKASTLAVRKFGESRGFLHLTVSKWPADEADAWNMSAVAAHLLDARGLYRIPGETGSTYLLITDIQRISLNPH